MAAIFFVAICAFHGPSLVLRPATRSAAYADGPAGRDGGARTAPRTRPATCSAADAAGSTGGDEDAWNVKAADISRELARLQLELTPASRVRTSAPMRYTVAALDDTKRAARGVGRFFTDIATTVPTNRVMLAVIVAAFCLQSATGKAMYFAGAWLPYNEASAVDL